MSSITTPQPPSLASFSLWKMWWARKPRKLFGAWNSIPLWGFQPFCWICILTTCLSNWKSGVRAQSLDLWYGNYLPFMPETFRESRDPEAAAGIFEGLGGRNGLHMTLSTWKLSKRIRLWLTSLIIRASEVVPFWNSSSGGNGKGVGVPAEGQG